MTNKYRIARRIGQISALGAWLLLGGQALADVLLHGQTTDLGVSANDNAIYLVPLVVIALVSVIYGYSHDDQGNRKHYLGF